jgi:hypothetical protein
MFVSLPDKLVLILFFFPIVSTPVLWNFFLLDRHWKNLSTGAYLMKKENRLEYWVGGLHVQSHL